MSARRWLWRHPEVLALGLSAAAWVLLFAPIGIPSSLSMSGMSMRSSGRGSMPSHMSMAGMSGTMGEDGTSAAATRLAAMPRFLTMSGISGAISTRDTTSVSRGVGAGWTLQMFMLMVVAMMLPSATEPIRLTAALSLWRRRIRAIVEWILGFVAVWLLAGAAILCARQLAMHNGLLPPGRVPMMTGLLIAAAWQLTPLKRLSLNGCHRLRPLAPHGPRADRDCVLYGAMIGRECVLSCGPMMAAMTLCDRNQAIVTLAMTAVVLGERLRRRTPRKTSALALGLLALALL
jgi:predicted metal-binding membrane protein